MRQVSPPKLALPQRGPLLRAAPPSGINRLVFLGLAPMVGDTVVGTLGLVAPVRQQYPGATIDVVLDQRAAQIFGNRRQGRTADGTPWQVRSFAIDQLLPKAAVSKIREFNNYFTDTGDPLESGHPDLSTYGTWFPPLAEKFCADFVRPALTPQTLVIYNHDDLLVHILSSVVGLWSFGRKFEERFLMKIRPVFRAYDHAIHQAVEASGAFCWDTGHSVGGLAHYTTGSIFGGGGALTPDQNAAMREYVQGAFDRRWGRLVSAYDYWDRTLHAGLGQGAGWQIERDFLLDPEAGPRFEAFLASTFTEPNRRLLFFNCDALSADNAKLMSEHLEHVLDGFLGRVLRILPKANILCLPHADPRFNAWVAEKRQRGQAIAVLPLSDRSIWTQALAAAGLVVSADTGCVHVANAVTDHPKRVITYGFNNRVETWSLPQNGRVWDTDPKALVQKLLNRTLMAWLGR